MKALDSHGASKLDKQIAEIECAFAIGVAYERDYGGQLSVVARKRGIDGSPQSVLRRSSIIKKIHASFEDGDVSRRS